MSRLRLGVLADDLTGAHASAARLRGRGLRTVVAWDATALPETQDALVVDMGSRDSDLPPAMRAAHWARALLGVGCTRLELRVDTTLRGATAAELAGVIEGAELGDPVIVAVPAYPDGGRTTVDGRQRVTGDHEGERWIDARERIFAGRRVSVIGLDVVDEGADAIAAAAFAAIDRGCRCFVVDATEDRHLAAAAASLEPLARGGPVLTVSSGAWLRHYPVVDDRFVLVGLASRTPANEAQLARLVRDGDATVCTPERALADPAGVLEGAAGVIVVETLSLAGGSDATPATQAASAVRALLEHADDTGRSCVGLIASGGHAAASLVRALGARGLEPIDEVEALCPRGTVRDGRWTGLPLITKGGLIGTTDTLRALVDALRPQPQGERCLTISQS